MKSAELDAMTDDDIDEEPSQQCSQPKKIRNIMSPPLFNTA